MKTFNNLEEIKPYYNENTNTYEFIENQKIIDVEFNFDLNIDRNIKAFNITARNIKASNINAMNITAFDIKACDINAFNIKSCNIKSCNIEACDIEACDIEASNIKAWNIKAWNIKACDIDFFAICFSYKTFICNSIKGRRENSKYFCLDSEVVINKKED